jgi:hypothetical protein
VVIDKIRKSKKQILKNIFSVIERDVRSTTGQNLRMLMLQCDRSDLSEIQLSDMGTLPYIHPAKDEEWQTEMLRHLLQQRQQGPLDKEDLE